MDKAEDSQTELMVMAESFRSSFSDFEGPKEQALINSIKKLALENETIKQNLANHNKLIEKYCVDLESLKNHQIKEKEETLGTIQKLEAENQTYKNKLSNYSLKLDIPEQSNEISSKLNKIHTFVGEVLKSVEKCKKDESLKCPVQETQQSILTLQCHLEELRTSITNIERLSPNYDMFAWKGKEEKMNQKIEELKAELSERMKNDEELHLMENKIQEMEESNATLVSERDKLKKMVVQLQQKIEQLEFEPSVEVMQVASPQQTKIIDGLNAELIKAKDQIKSLFEENECLLQKVNSLNEVCMKMSQDASQHSISEGREISEIKDTYETAISGLRDEIEKEKKVCEELRKINADLTENFEEQRKLQSTEGEESASMKRTIEMYRKRESKDLDRLNQVTCERDTYKKEFESKLLLIKELNEKIESLTNENTATVENLSDEGIAQNKIGETSGLVDRIEVLRRQLSSGEQAMGILSEENTNLKEALKAKMEDCSCHEMSKKIDLLVQENEDLQFALAKRDESLEDRFNQDKNKVEQLEEMVRQLRDDRDRLLQDFKKKQLKDGEIIQRLNEELMAHNEDRKASLEEANQCQKVLEDTRQKNDVLEARLEKSNNDSKKMWQNYESIVKHANKLEQQIKEMEEVNEGARIKQNKMESYLDERYEEIKKMQRVLMNKEREIERLKSELQNIDIFRAQVEIYENDFRMEREAREKQHSDMLILREDVHRLELENNRLRAEVESDQWHKVQELQRRFANSSPNIPNAYYKEGMVYGRGGAPVPDNGMDHHRSSDFGRGSIDLPPQESDQVVQRQCPKCCARFPDLDTLQIHVLECVD